jgi:hypothetical protein
LRIAEDHLLPLRVFRALPRWIGTYVARDKHLKGDGGRATNSCMQKRKLSKSENHRTKLHQHPCSVYYRITGSRLQTCSQFRTQSLAKFPISEPPLSNPQYPRYTKVVSTAAHSWVTVQQLLPVFNSFIPQYIPFLHQNPNVESRGRRRATTPTSFWSQRWPTSGLACKKSIRITYHHFVLFCLWDSIRSILVCRLQSNARTSIRIGNILSVSFHLKFSIC